MRDQEWVDTLVSRVVSVVSSKVVSFINFAEIIVAWATVSAVRTAGGEHDLVPSCQLVHIIAIHIL